MAGKKMNSRSEVAHGFEYLGLRSYRFYMTCPNCHAEFTIRTDPKESDYVAESNCRRLYDPYKHEDENSVRKWLEGTDTSNEGPEAELRNLEQSKMDAMELLEQRTLQSKMEMGKREGEGERERRIGDRLIVGLLMTLAITMIMLFLLSFCIVFLLVLRCFFLLLSLFFCV